MLSVSGLTGLLLVVQAWSVVGPGNVSSTGLYSAPANPSGEVRVIFRHNGFADTSVGRFVSSGFALGVPFGPFAILAEGAPLAPFTMGVQGTTASNLLGYIAKAEAAGGTILLNMTGGAHSNYMSMIRDTLRFDLAKWRAAMDKYNTPAIRDAVAFAVSRGTIVGNSVMDEPHVFGAGDGNTWGPERTMNKGIVDDMCAYVKAIFPTLPVGVAHNYTAFEPTKSYRTCEFVISQYASRLGSVTAWRDGALSMAARDRYAAMLSINVLNGGTQDRVGVWGDGCAFGKGTYAPNCRMSPTQFRESGLTLGPAGCALVIWKYDAGYFGVAANRQAATDVAAALRVLPRKTCVRV